MTIADIAREMKVSAMTVHRHIDRKKALLRGHVHREGKKTVVSQEGVEILRASILETTVKAVPVESAPPAPISPEVAARIEQLEKSVMLLVDRLTRQESENSRQAKEIEDLRARVDPPALPAPAEIVRPDPRQVVERKVLEKPRQHDTVSAWEGIRMAFDDLLGFAFGRG